MKFLRLSFSIRYVAAALLAVAVLCSCHRDNSEPASDSLRTVLVYMVSSNDLGRDGYADRDLAEMEAGIKTLPSRYRWLVYQSTYDKNEPARLFEITPKGRVQLKTYSQGESVTAARMHQVISHVESIAPAASYGLVMWSHAYGWVMDGIDDPGINPTAPSASNSNVPAPVPGIQPTSFGNDFGNRMNVTTLASVLSQHRFDYVYFDACYMSTVEVAYQLRHAVKTIVGSPSELPADGMPYDRNMKYLALGTVGDLKTAAANTFNHYNLQSEASSRTCTMAVINTAWMDSLASATRDIYRLTPLPHPGSVVTNYRGTSRQGQSIDFGEYVNALAQASDVDPNMTRRFNNHLDSAVVYHAATPKLWDVWPIYSSSGLATYVFNSTLYYGNYGYDRLEWATDVVSHHLH